MNDFSENNTKLRSAGQSADRHQKFTIAVIAIMVIVILGTTIWLIRMTDTAQLDMNDTANINVPITSSTAKVVTRKKQFEKHTAPLPERKRPPINAKPREELPPDYGEHVTADPDSLPPGVLVN